MRTRLSLPLCALAATFFLLLSSCGSEPEFRTLSLEEYRSKMQAGWLGQMAGVGQGAPTEFKFNALIIPAEEVPEWTPAMINQQWQDDIYVEMTFLKTLEDYGFDVSIRQAGIDFANSEYRLWHANLHGRENLRSGIAPPWSGHPEFNSHADDIDYQIEADYSGLIAPGLPAAVMELGDVFGRLMNYGDGLYGGLFVGAMYAEAYFEKDIRKIIDAGLAVIPAESQYTEAILDVIQWYDEDPDNWQGTWRLIEDKYNLNPDYRRFSCNGDDPGFNIDAKINGAYIAMGLLYGEGDMDSTIVISMRCGQDSDCNPSNAAGILATSMGLENLPDKYQADIDMETKFSFTAYNFPALLDVCEKLAREAVVRAGGICEVEGASEIWKVPIQQPDPGELEQCWEAAPVPRVEDGFAPEVYYSDEEMGKLSVKIRKHADYITTWQVALAFSHDGEDVISLLDHPFPPEQAPEFSLWSELPDGELGNMYGLVDLAELNQSQHCVAYLKSTFSSPEARDVILELGSDDGVKLWLNGNVVHENAVIRGHTQGEDVVETRLKKGENHLLIKVAQGTGGWGASLVITDLEGKPLKDLEF